MCVVVSQCEEVVHIISRESGGQGGDDLHQAILTNLLVLHEQLSTQEREGADGQGWNTNRLYSLRQMLRVPNNSHPHSFSFQTSKITNYLTMCCCTMEIH